MFVTPTSLLLAAALLATQVGSSAHADVPAAPTAVIAVPGGTESAPTATVSWTAPASDVTDYVVTAQPDVGGDGVVYSRDVTGGTSTTVPLSLEGSYEISVTAVSADGTSAPSASVPITAQAVPAATVITATEGDGSAAVSWSGADLDTSNPVTGYIVTATPAAGKTVTDQVTGTSATLTGLTNSTNYVISVTSANATGTGASGPSVNVTPTAGAASPTVPATPLDFALTPAGAASWTAPSNDGGSPIGSYTVTAVPSGGSTMTASVKGQTRVQLQLATGTSYTVFVTAANAVGTSQGTPAIQVTAAPDLPQDIYVNATSGDSSAEASWSASSDGGSPITSWTVTLAQGGSFKTAAPFFRWR